jgi:subtilisin family serine protease
LLEDRTLPNAAWLGSLPGQDTPRAGSSSQPYDGTVPVVWDGAVLQAQPGQWVAGFTGVSGSADQQVAAIQQELTSSLPADLKATVVRTLGLDGQVVIQVSPDAPEYRLKVLADLPDISYVGPNITAPVLTRVPNDPDFSKDWGMQNTGQVVQGSPGVPGADVSATRAWDLTTGSYSFVVADIDTGLDYTHPDIRDNVWLNNAEIPTSRLQNLKRYVSNPSNPDDTSKPITFADLNDSRNWGLFKIMPHNDGSGHQVVDANDVLAPMNRDASGNDLGTGGWAFPNNTADGDTAHPNDYVGWNFVNNTNRPFDDNSHGTHTGGTIGAEGNNGTGVAGVLWTTQIMPVKWIAGGGSGTDADAIAAVNYSVLHGARVSSNSWHIFDFNVGLYNAVKNARDHGDLFIAAAQNSSLNNDVQGDFPAIFTRATSAGPALDNVIAVAATDNRDRLASFSNYGLHTVQLGAPGVDVWSTFPNNRYGYDSGTSMATPHVAGAAALLWGTLPSANYLEITNALLNGVDPIASLSGRTTTGGRLDVFHSLQLLGLNATAISPANGATVVGAAPTTFVIGFGSPVTPGFSAGVFQVNGVSANAVVLSNNNQQATFTFTTSPVTSQGLQTETIAAGAIRRASDNSPLAAFSASFHYALVQLQVTSTNPPVGSTIDISGTPLTYDVNFSTAVDPNSVHTTSLTLSGVPGAAVSAVTVLAGNTTARFTITGLSTEATLTASIAAGAVTDPFGNPGAAFSGTYLVHYNLFPYPTPLAPVAPLGSLIYDPSLTGTIVTTGQTDSFTLPLAAGQSIGLLVTPSGSTLRPTVQLFDPTNNLVASATASAAGRPALIDATAITAPGTYRIVVGAAAGTGGYTIQAFLDTALEEALYGGPTDTSQATAQSLEPSFVQLSALDSNPQRGTVLGQLAVTGVPPPEFYSFHLNAGQSATAAATSLDAFRNVSVTLLDSSGNLLALGRTGSTSVGSVINNFVAPSTDTYYVRVNGTALAHYSLVVTRDADFATKPNSNFLGGQAQAVLSNTTASGQTILGYVAGAETSAYQVQMQAGQTLHIQTQTPLDSGGPVANVLVPKVNVFDSTGTLVATSMRSAPDGKNVLLDFVVPSGGDGFYFVQVTSANGSSGEYVLTIAGDTGTQPDFAVTTTNPANHAVLRIAPGAITVGFNDSVLLSTVTASALTVDGVAATSFQLVDATHVQFNLPSVGQGLHQVNLASTIFDVHGRPVDAYAGDFTLDSIGPRVTSSSIQEGDVLSSPNIFYLVSFDKGLDPSKVNASDFILRGLLRNQSYAVASFNYVPAAASLVLQYTNLPSDQYTLTLVSGPFNLVDVNGNPLDGAPNWPMPPNESGTGNPFSTGNFFVDFGNAVGAVAYPTNLTAVRPLGSLVYQGPTVPDVLVSSTDIARYQVAVNAGESITALVTPTTAALQPVVSLFDSTGRLVALATAPAAGQPVVLQTGHATGSPATNQGYTVQVTDAGGNVGLYSLQVALDAGLEASQYGGPSDNSRDTAQDLNPLFSALPKGASVAAVLGKTPQVGGYAATAVTPTFEDISATGHPTLQGTDDSVIQLTPANLGGFTFPLFGTTYNNVYFSTNALINFTTFDGSFFNSNLTTSPSEAVVAPLWTDYVAFDASSVVYWQVLGAGSSQRLVIEWKNVQYFGGGPFLTLEAVLGVDGSMQFNYQNVNNAVRGTAGIKDAGSQGTNRLLLAFNNGPNSFVGNNLSTRIAPVAPASEFYSFHLDAGQSVSLALSGLTPIPVTEELQDSNGNVLATGTTVGGNVDKAINNFVAPADGTYFVRISGGSLANYALVVTRGAAFDNGTNNTRATAQDISGTAGALGYLAAVTGTSVVPGNLANTNANSPNNFPFNIFGFASQMHYQQIYAASQLGSGGAIDAVRFRRFVNFPTFGPTTIDAKISLGYAATTVATVAPTFANNVGTGGLVTVFDGTMTISSTGSGSPNPFDVVIPAGDLFNYDPTRGDLLLDIQMRNAPSTTLFDASGFGQQSATARVYANSLAATSGTINANGESQPFGLVTRIDFVTSIKDEWFKFTATAGQTLTLATFTPGDGGGMFVNGLNPHFQLLDSNGNVVATGVIGPDGHNEQILYTVPAGAGGTYFLHIMSANGSPGEFFLDPESTTAALPFAIPVAPSQTAVANALLGSMTFTVPASAAPGPVTATGADAVFTTQLSRPSFADAVNSQTLTGHPSAVSLSGTAGGSMDGAASGWDPDAAPTFDSDAAALRALDAIFAGDGTLDSIGWLE